MGCPGWHPRGQDYYEVAYILNDDGFGVGIFVPRQGYMDPELLALCAGYASALLERELP